MIIIDDLSISYGDKEIIKNLKCNLALHQIHGIVGLNGAGKSTLLNAIFGLKKAKRGSLFLGDRALKQSDISYVESENYFYSYITGSEYLSIFNNDEKRINEWNKIFKLPLDEVIDNYSTGMKKKLGIMAVLDQTKPIIILDEPFNGLDLETCRVIREILLRLKANGKTILITSHILETLTNLCDTLHHLENGFFTLSSERSGFSSFQDIIFDKIEIRNRELIESML